MRQIIIFAIAFLFIQSCGNKGNKDLSNDSLDGVSIVIDIDSVKYDSLKLSKIKFIPLETSRECIIGDDVDKVLIKNDKIYVADTYQTKSLFVFDLNGKFLFKIAKIGKGPGEYVSFSDFDIGADGDIYMFDISSKKIRIYSSSEGEYLRDIKLDNYLMRFCLVGNKIYLSRLLLDGVMFANLAVYDTIAKQTDMILDDERFLYDLPEYSFGFHYSPKNMYYTPKFSEIIYSLDEKGTHPAIGIKNLKMPPKHIINEWVQEKDAWKQSQKMAEDNYFVENVRIYETDTHIVFRYVTGDFMHSHKVILYNKLSKTVSYSNLKDYFLITGSSVVMGSTGADFFTVVGFNSRNQFHTKILETREELANWVEDDNPVIVIFNY